jgi:hypothetical protein
MYMWKVESSLHEHSPSVSDSGPPPPPDPPAQCARNMMVFAHYHRFAPASNSDVGLPGRLSHPGPRFFDICSFDCMLDFVLCHHCLPSHTFAVRVLSCSHVPVPSSKHNDSSDCARMLDEWILELESPLVLFSGNTQMCCTSLAFVCTYCIRLDA